ncbi:hypothetical protein MGYG_04961 [Nannizzia gypsea CBS 118893]|uniref:Uncharacterized protein n=1 Tax=Arthroderma gypseum (strain ATCC MYA-4604 / CBS 118893) TaxID=535722 RepID=E4UXR5_ARTGP|nr:hypothetical protein MGYG_04961 [Nannizzia gypsea CBS 118893]EFR01960.1 hypothetical protein MGYG_04961 [Nannizzia gypsea CBS 118893]
MVFFISFWENERQEQKKGVDYQALLSARNGELDQPIKEVWSCNTNRRVREVSDEAEGAAVLKVEGEVDKKEKKTRSKCMSKEEGKIGQGNKSRQVGNRVVCPGLARTGKDSYFGDWRQLDWATGRGEARPETPWEPGYSQLLRNLWLPEQAGAAVPHKACHSLS